MASNGKVTWEARQGLLGGLTIAGGAGGGLKAEKGDRQSPQTPVPQTAN